MCLFVACDCFTVFAGLHNRTELLPCFWFSTVESAGAFEARGLKIQQCWISAFAASISAADLGGGKLWGLQAWPIMPQNTRKMQ